jgi:hypothetical protein
MLRFETLVAALLVSAPALWDAFTTGNTSVDTALIRFLIAVPVCGIGLLLIRKLFDAYTLQRPAMAAAEQALDETRAVLQSRRRGDAPVGPEATSR